MIQRGGAGLHDGWCVFGLRARPVLILGIVGYVCTDWGMVVYGWVVECEWDALDRRLYW
jgi:hypothetical protein